MGNKSRWIWTLVQGIAALALGLWTLFGRESALTALHYGVGAYLLIAGALGTINSLVYRKRPGAQIELLRGLIGLIGGALVLILALFTSTSMATLSSIMAVVLIIYGAVDLFTTLFARGDRPFEWGPIIVSALLLVLGILIFLDQSSQSDLITWAGTILAIIGVVLILYALLRQRKQRNVTKAL